MIDTARFARVATYRPGDQRPPPTGRLEEQRAVHAAVRCIALLGCTSLCVHEALLSLILHPAEVRLSRPFTREQPA